MEPAEAQRGELQPEPEPAGMSFPPPPRTKTFNAEALAKYRLTRAIYGAEPSLALLLVSLRGADKREPKCYASARGSELQFHVEDLELALAQLRNHAAAPDWQIWAVGKSEHEQQKAKRIAMTPTAAALRAAEANVDGRYGAVPLSGGVNMPAPSVAETAITRLAKRVADGQSLESPDTFKTNPVYEVNKDVEDIYRRWDQHVTEEEFPVYEKIVRSLVDAEVASERHLQRAINEHRKRLHVTPRKSKLLHVYNMLVTRGDITHCESLRACLMSDAALLAGQKIIQELLRGAGDHSYTDSVTGKRVTQRFSCQWNCHYCPDEPGQPRSYLHDEPSVLRANQNEFDPVLQFTDRAATLAMNGHPVDKIELLVLGGTWASYPQAYQEEFCRDLFYAANTFYDRAKRARGTLLEEQQRNETAMCKVIGLTLETRPDCITLDEVRRFRRYGCTRVQLGIQHTDDTILKRINRGCTTADAKRAIRLLKDACYKIDIHLMPNLPGASPEIDRRMFQQVLEDPGLQADQWKIYPCETVPWTVLKKWYESGKYKPYEEALLFEMLIDVKSKVHPWIRLNRVIRDIPSQYILGGLNVPNLRQTLLSDMAKRGLRCSCIRCREVGLDSNNAVTRAELVERKYRGSDADEIFLSFETTDTDQTICGFLRLRLPAKCDGMNAKEERIDAAFPELRGCALIRELHVYGVMQCVGARVASTIAPGGTNEATADTQPSQAPKQLSQHGGFGRQLMQRAEQVAISAGFRKIAVISGVGVRNYYRRLGYELLGDGQFLIKQLDRHVSQEDQALYAKDSKALHTVGIKNVNVIGSDSSIEDGEGDDGECDDASEADQLNHVLCWGVAVVVGAAVVYKHMRGSIL